MPKPLRKPPKKIDQKNYPQLSPSSYRMSAKGKKREIKQRTGIGKIIVKNQHTPSTPLSRLLVIYSLIENLLVAANPALER